MRKRVPSRLVVINSLPEEIVHSGVVCIDGSKESSPGELVFIDRFDALSYERVHLMQISLERVEIEAIFINDYLRKEVT